MRGEACLKEGEQQEGESDNKSSGDETVSCAFVDKNIMSGCCRSVGRDNLRLCEGTHSTVHPLISS